MGQIKVIDYKANAFQRNKTGRALLVNHTCQTIMDLQDPAYSLRSFAMYSAAPASHYPPGSKALLLGIGGGTLVKQLQRLQFELDVVELDPRIVEVAREHFHVGDDFRTIVDDGRHYLHPCESSYDVIVLDMFLSESQVCR